MLNEENVSTFQHELIISLKNKEIEIEFFIRLLLYASKFSLQTRKFFPGINAEILTHFPSYNNICDIIDNTNNFISAYFKITKSIPTFKGQLNDQHLQNIPLHLQLHYLFYNCANNTLPYYIRNNDTQSIQECFNDIMP